MNSVRTTVAFLAAAGALASGAAPALAQEQFQWSGRVAEGRAIEIKGVNGDVNAVAAPGGEVRVTATKRGRRSSPAEVLIEVVEHAGGVTICAVYPTRGGRANECQPGPGGRNQVQNNDVQVEWTVHVPRGVHFTGRTVNGDVSGTGLPADAEGRTVNGSVRLTTAGVARASTVNGSVDVSMARSDWTGKLDLETVNGSVTARFGGDLNALVSATTVNGGIETDYPLEVRGRFTARSVSGTIGAGGRELSLRTVNGGIRIARM
jgi:cytoskeletal protein CcmA (bactofilin family)